MEQFLARCLEDGRRIGSAENLRSYGSACFISSVQPVRHWPQMSGPLSSRASLAGLELAVLPWLPPCTSSRSHRRRTEAGSAACFRSTLFLAYWLLSFRSFSLLASANM